MEKTVENFMRFALNDNLKRFIKEVDLSELNKTENKTVAEIIKHIDESNYDVNVTLYGDSSVTLNGCKCFVDFDHDCVIVKQPHDVSQLMMHDALGHDDFRISTSAIRSGLASFTNTLFTRQNETHLFEMLLSEDTCKTNYTYKFNVDAFESIPEIHCSRLIMIDSRVFELRRFSENHIDLANPCTCQYCDKNPLQLLTDGYYPVPDVEFMNRNSNGLLIPKLSEIIPLCEYKPIDNEEE